jgi:ferredoxin-NADP reductase
MVGSSVSLPPTFHAKLERARMLTPSVRELVFARSDGTPMAFEAGQWVSLALPMEEMPGGELRRAYSIASRPDGTPRFSVAVTHVKGGPGSTMLHAMEVGTELPVIGPQGFFTRPLDRSGPSLFVGTGTGVTPLFSMLSDALAQGEKRALWMLCGNRTEADVLYRAELDAFAAAHPNVRVVHTLSRADPGWAGRRGWVQEHVRELHDELVPRGEGTVHVYICGLQRMVGAVRDLLRKDMKLLREQVHSERYD